MSSLGSFTSPYQSSSKRARNSSDDLIDDDFENVMNFRFDEQACREALAKAIIIHEYPFSIVSHIGFIQFCQTLQPLFNMVSPATIRSDCENIYLREKDRLFETFEKIPSSISITSSMWTSIRNYDFEKIPSRISITCSMWTSTQNYEYIATSAHYVDTDWKLKKCIISFSHLPSPDNGSSIFNSVRSTLIKWKIDEKFLFLTLDNASSNDDVQRLLGNYLNQQCCLPLAGEIFHSRCSTHVFVETGLMEIQHFISNVRESIKYVKSLPSRKKRFDEITDELGMGEQKRLVLDVSTWWNSTYLMLESVLGYQAVFARLKEEDSSYKFMPSDHDWINAQVLCCFLKSFYDITKTFSETSHPTSHLFLRGLHFVHKEFVEKEKNSNDFCRIMLGKMQVIFDEYRRECSPLFELALVLDPRCKLGFLKYVLVELYGEEEGSLRFDKRVTVIKLLFDEYKGKSCLVEGKDGGERNKTEDSFKIGFLKWRKEHGFLDDDGNEKKSELDIYLEEWTEKNTPEFDILSWWRAYSTKFKILSVIARDILAIPFSTITSEYAFSTEGQVLDEYKSSYFRRPLNF